jgi:hypothetical protein
MFIACSAVRNVAPQRPHLAQGSYGSLGRVGRGILLQAIETGHGGIEPLGDFSVVRPGKIVDAHVVAEAGGEAFTASPSLVGGKA